MKPALTKEHTGQRLTWFGRLLSIILILAVLFGLFRHIYDFLAPDKPPHRGLLVVEGWMHDFALDEAVRMYRAGDYSKIISTGTPVETGSYIQQFKSYPEMTTARLLAMGVNQSEIITAVTEDSMRDRTYASAVSMREHLIAHNIQETDIHLISVGPHGRRNRLLYGKGLGEEYNVGVTCLDPAGYEKEKWYSYSHGFRSVIGEAIAYFYARVLFYP